MEIRWLGEVELGGCIIYPWRPIFRPSRRIKIYFEMYEIWLKAEKDFSSAEEENILGNVALSPPAKAGGYMRNIWKSGGSVK